MISIKADAPCYSQKTIPLADISNYDITDDLIQLPNWKILLNDEKEVSTFKLVSPLLCFVVYSWIQMALAL